MSDKKYNGWTNYETWAVALSIDNEQSSYLYWREEAERHYREAAKSDRVRKGACSAAQSATLALAEQLRDEIRDDSPLDAPTVYTDLLNAALGEVDWYQIAVELLADRVAIGTKTDQPDKPAPDAEK